MKKVFLLFVVVSLIFGIVGCSGDNKKVEVTPVEFVTKEISQVPEAVRDYCEQEMVKESYKAVSWNDTNFVFASRGEMSSGGFEISIENIGIKDDRLYVGIKTTDPQTNEQVIEAVTYPFVIAELSEGKIPLTVVFVEADDFDKIIEEVQFIDILEALENVVTLYFGTEEGLLRQELRTVSLIPIAENGDKLVEELIKGTNSDDSLDVIPKGTKILNYTFDAENGLATIDFSQEIYAATGSMGESLAIYAVVNTLTELPEVEMVQILIEGKVVETISGHVYTGEPIERNVKMFETNILK